MASLRARATEIVKRLVEAGHEAFFAGGCVRDMLLGRDPQDYDITTSARPEQVRQLFDNTVPVGEQFGVVLVVLDDTHFEVATFRTEGDYLDGRRPSEVAYAGAEEDVRRRDFTVNGLLYDPLHEQVTDYVGGRADLTAGVIRAIGPPRQRFAEDKLRLLRAVRLAANLDFEIESDTLAAVGAMAADIAVVSWERISEELLKLLTRPGAARGLQMLHDTGLLKAILPEVERTVGLPQPPQFHPEGDVFTHTKLMLDMLDGPTPSLALGVLLHDVGKPDTYKVAQRIRFDSHTKVGAELAKSICRRLRCGRDLTDRVVYLVANHLRIKDAPRMRPSKLKRFLRDDGFDELLELFRLDVLASHGDLSVHEFCQQQKGEYSEEEIRPRPLLTGQDLIEMGYRPGPLFREILEAVEDAQLEGTITTPAEARQLVARRWKPEASANG